MNFQYNCPECKNELLIVENKLCCDTCNNNYLKDGNFIDFKDNVSTNIFQDNLIIKEILLDIEQNGYELGIKKFLISNKDYESQISRVEYDKSIDIIFHGMGRNCHRCLDIKSGFGNKAKILSNIFKQVYTVEFDDNITEFLKKRFNEEGWENISVSRCNVLKLPFPDGFFDLILCNDILDNISKIFKTDNEEDFQKQLILELRRVTNDNGCVIFGVSNRKRKIRWKKYNDTLRTNSDRKFSEYISIFQKTGFKVKAFWALPSHNKPYYSGDIFDKKSLMCFFKNMSTFISTLRGGKKEAKKLEIMLFIIKNTNYYLMKKIMQFFAPSFVFCCWKKDDHGSIENWIKSETGYNSILRMSRHEKNLFMLINTSGEIDKAVYIRRFGYDIPEHIKNFEREFPDVKEPICRIWIVNWIKGQLVNPNKENEVYLMINWLIQFQKMNKLKRMNKDDVNSETMFIRKGLEHFKYNDTDKYLNWLKEYEKYVETNQIFMTPVHGDFWFPNVLYDPKNRKINVIDWETYSEEGNPFEDFIWFLCNLIGMSSQDPVLKFKQYLEGNGNMNRVLEKIKNQIDAYFGFELDYILLMRVNLMKWMIIQDQIRERSGDESKMDNQTKIHLRILDILSHY